MSEAAPPPPQALSGDELELAVDVKGAQAGDKVTFTVAAGGGSDVLTTLDGAVSGGSAKAIWKVDPGTRTLPLPVAIKAALRGQSLPVGQTTILSGSQVSTLGWLDEKGRAIPIDLREGARVVAAGGTVVLKFDVADSHGGLLQEKLRLTFILERESSPGAFAEAGRFEDSVPAGVGKFERPFQTPDDATVPAKLRIVVEARREGEAGGAPSLGRRTSPPLKVIRVAPLVTSFVATEPSTGSANPAEQVALGPGQSARLFWDILGAFQAVRIDPGKKDVSKEPSARRDGVVSSAVTIDPLKEPPDADGHYTIVATNQGLDSPPRQVTVIAITRFAMSLSADQPPGATPHTLTLFDENGRGPKQRNASEIPGRAAPFADQKHQVDGEVTPFSKIKLDWKVIGAKGVKLRLVVHKGAIVKDDVDPAGSFELDDPSKGRATFDAELQVLEDKGGKPGEVLARGILHVREGFPFPSVKSLEALDDKTPVADGGSVSSWDNLRYRWALEGDPEGCKRGRLVVKITSGGKSFEEEFKPAKDARTTADAHPVKGGPFEGEVVAEARLLNEDGEQSGQRQTVRVIVGAKTHKLTVRVKTPKGPLPGAKVTAIDKTGKNHVGTTTSPAGEVAFPGVEAGDVSVIVEKQPLKQVIKSLQLTKDDTLEVEMADATPARFKVGVGVGKNKVLSPFVAADGKLRTSKVQFDLDIQETVSGGQPGFVQIDVFRPDGTLLKTERHESGPLVAKGKQTWEWDGYSDAKVLDTALLKTKGLKVQVTVGSPGEQDSVGALVLANEPLTFDWTDVRIDEAAARIETFARFLPERPSDPTIALTLGVVSISEFSDVITRIQEGVAKHWSRSLTIDGRAFTLVARADIGLKQKIFVEIVPEPPPLPGGIPAPRSCNPGIFSKEVISLVVFFVERRSPSLLSNPTWAEHFKNDDRETGGHELGHSIVAQRHGSTFSAEHKGTSSIGGDLKVPPATAYPAAPAEVDLMRYWLSAASPGAGLPPATPFDRLKLTEDDAKSLLEFTKVEFKT